MSLPFAYYGNPILRQKAKEVPEITDEIRSMVVEMERILKEHKGVGLAAPQASQGIRLFLTVKAEFNEDGILEYGDVRTFINPQLSEPSKETEVLSEGCLSIPGIQGPVERPVCITVTYTNLEGERVTEVFEGYEARKIMHENDHINGVLFIDRVDPKIRKEMEPHLKAIKRRKR